MVKAQLQALQDPLQFLWCLCGRLGPHNAWNHWDPQAQVQCPQGECAYKAKPRVPLLGFRLEEYGSLCKFPPILGTVI